MKKQWFQRFILNYIREFHSKHGKGSNHFFLLISNEFISACASVALATHFSTNFKWFICWTIDINIFIISSACAPSVEMSWYTGHPNRPLSTIAIQMDQEWNWNNNNNNKINRTSNIQNRSKQFSVDSIFKPFCHPFTIRDQNRLHLFLLFVSSLRLFNGIEIVCVSERVRAEIDRFNSFTPIDFFSRLSEKESMWYTQYTRRQTNIHNVCVCGIENVNMKRHYGVGANR